MVALARWYNCEMQMFFLKGGHEGRILKGWLHDSESTKLTDEKGEPKIDGDKWIQYCVKDMKVLGPKMLFIEFDINWKEWADSAAIDNDIASAWHQQAYVQSPPDASLKNKIFKKK
jgi:hypothetical protein